MFRNLFKYISCPGLTEPLFSNKNVYLKFKYISCPGLTCIAGLIDLMPDLFKYISCPGLTYYQKNTKHS